MNIELVSQREYQTNSSDGHHRRHGRIWQNIKG
jgi:hypothetical protein